MKKIVHHLWAHLKEDFHPGYYLTVGVLIAALMYLNYHAFPGVQFTKKLNVFRGTWTSLPIFMLWYGTPWFLAVLSFAAFNRKWEIFTSRDFWIRSILAIFFVAIDDIFYWHRDLVKAFGADLTSADRAYLTKLAGEALASLTAVTIPMFLFWKIYDRDQEHFYGMRIRGFEPGPYLMILGLLLPFVFAASFQEDFASYYPRLKPAQLDKITVLPRWPAFGVFEFLYLTDFAWTELLYRGFFIVGMAKTLGRGAVLPMSVVYCMIHFGKPEGESFWAISGGYILGVMSLRTQNLLGGVVVHMGIAGMMEGSALFQILRKL